MALIDAYLVLSEGQSAATTADTTNTLDFGGARELSNNYHGAGYVNIRCVDSVVGTTLTFQLKDSADNSTFAAVGEAVTLTGMKVGEVKTIKLPPTKRYVKGSFTATSVTGGKFTVYVGQPEA